MFSNAKSVEVNGKEVKSIILENGAILYKKNEPYLLSVTSDKNILSYNDNDVATLTATLTRNGVPVQGEEVIFHANKPIKETAIYSSGDTITLNEGEEILIPKNAQFNIDTGTNGSGDYFHWNNGDFEYGNINGDIVITPSDLGRTITVPKVSGTINTISSITIKKINGEYIVEDSNSDLVVEYSPNYDNGTLTTNLEIELGGDTNTISLITNNNGIVTYQYNSQGIGDIIFNINCMNLQGTYDVWDCLYFDLTTSDTHTNYSKVNADLTFDTDKLVLTRTADGECYANYSGTIANYKGKTIKFECEIDSPVNTHIRIYQQVGGSYSSVTSEYKTSGLFVATSEIDANATSILFRIMGNNLNSNQGLSFKNIKIYPI